LAMAIAEGWLQDGKLPSGKVWDDLTTHIALLTHEISGEKTKYTGWIAFAVLMKYWNHGGGLSVFNVEDKDKSDGGEGKRAEFCKKRKNMQNDEHSVATSGDISITGLNKNLCRIDVNTRLQMIELAHMKDSKKMKDIKTLLFHRNTVNNSLFT